MLEIAQKSMMPDALPVEIDERKSRAAKRHALFACRRAKSWNHAKKVGEQNEDRNRPCKSNKPPSAVFNVFVQQVADAEAQRIRQQHLRHLLGTAGPIDRKPRAQEKSQHRAEEQRDQRHHHVFGNWSLGMPRRNVEHGKESQRITPEIVIHKMGEPAYVLFHTLLRRTQDLIHACGYSRSP